MLRKNLSTALLSGSVFAVALVGVCLSTVRGGGNLDTLINSGTQVESIKWHPNAFPVKWLLNNQGAANNFNNGNATSVSVNDTKNSVEAGFFTWNAVNTSQIAFQYGGQTSTTDIGLDGKNVVTWLDPGAMGGAPFLAVAPSTYLTADLTVNSSNRDLNLDGLVDLDPALYPNGTVLPAGTIIDSDISFNSEDYDWVTNPVGGPSIFDIQAVATHEQGHTQGLSHSTLSGPTATMYPFVLSSADAQLAQRVLSPDDRASSSRLYPEAHFITSFATISGRVLLDELSELGGSGVSVFAVDATTLEPVTEVFSKSQFDADGNPAGSFEINGLPPGRYLVGARFFDGADDLGVFLNRYNTTIGLSNVNNGNASAADGFGLSFAPRPEFYQGGDGNADDLPFVEIIDVSQPGATRTGVEIIVNTNDPVPPPGSTSLQLGDDGFKEILFPAGFAFTFYDTVYNSVFVGSNGYLTFGSGDTDFTESVSDFEGPEPRIAPLFDDLNPGALGTTDATDVYFEQGTEELTITYLAVPEANNAPANTVVVTLNKNGEIRFDYAFMRARDGIAGISPGGSNPPSHEIDFTQELTYQGDPDEALYERFFAISDPLDLWGGRLVFTPDEEGGYVAEFTPPMNELVTRLTDLAPDRGPESGGTTVTLYGFGFTTAEDTTVQFGGVLSTDIAVLGPTSMTAVTPPGTGTVDVSVTNGNGMDTANGGFTYAPAPILSSLTPDFGPETGGTLVTLTGSHFETGNLAVTFGAASATDVQLVNPTKITARTPAGTGVVTVSVSNDNGTGTKLQGYSYIPAPSVTSISPSFGPEFGGTQVTITGSSFSPAFETEVYFGDEEASDVTVLDSTTLTATSPEGEGVADVKVINSNGFGILNDGFSYIAPPAIVSISPSAGPSAGGTRVTLQGSNFYNEGILSVFFGDKPGQNVTVESLTTISVTTPVAAPGEVDVLVSNFYGFDSASDGFTYLSPPRLDLVTPAFGPPSGGTLVTLSGAHFASGGTPQILFGGQPLLSVQVLSENEITGMTPAGTGQVAVTLENANGTDLLPNGFEYGVPPEIECRYGNVNENAGPVANVLFVNGSPGDDERIITMSTSTPLECTVDAPPSLPSAHYIVYIYFGEPGAGTEVELPFGLGKTCFPVPLTGGFPQPFIIANNLGWYRIMGRPSLPSSQAPEKLFRLKFGTRTERTLFLQGFMEDPTDPTGISVTNGIVVHTVRD